MSIVSNSSPLIHLASVGDLHLLKQLFRRIRVPPAVYSEVVELGGTRPGARETDHAVSQGWIVVSKLASESECDRIMSDLVLERGEAEAIALALETNTEAILLDEEAAVAHARSAGLRVVRSAGVYMAAREAGLIASVRERLDRLRDAGFWLHDRDYAAILVACGEIK